MRLVGEAGALKKNPAPTPSQQLRAKEIAAEIREVDESIERLDEEGVTSPRLVPLSLARSQHTGLNRSNDGMSRSATSTQVRRTSSRDPGDLPKRLSKLASGPPAVTPPSSPLVSSARQSRDLEREIARLKTQAVHPGVVQSLVAAVSRLEDVTGKVEAQPPAAATAPDTGGADTAVMQASVSAAVAELHELRHLAASALAAAQSTAPKAAEPVAAAPALVDNSAAIAEALAAQEQQLRKEFAAQQAAQEKKLRQEFATKQADEATKLKETVARADKAEHERELLRKKLDSMTRQFDMVQEQVAQQLGIGPGSGGGGGGGRFGGKSIRARANKKPKKEGGKGGILSPGRGNKGAVAATKNGEVLSISKPVNKPSVSDAKQAATDLSKSAPVPKEAVKSPRDPDAAKATMAVLKGPIPEYVAPKSMPKLKIKEVIEKLLLDDPSIEQVDFSNKSTFSNDHAIKLAKALANNTHCREVHLRNCSIITSGGKALGEMLASNQAIRVLNLEKNKIKTDGIEAIGKGLHRNTTLVELNLFQNAEPGSAACEAFIRSFDTNMTLLKINWRITSRQSFAINKAITRNNEIMRRRKEGKSFDDLLPWTPE